MSMVELRRNSLPHLGVLPLAASPPVWRKTSHPPLFPPPSGEVPFDAECHMDNAHQHVSTEVYHRMITETECMTALVKTITAEAKSVIKAETCSLFLLDKGELVARVFDKGGELKEIRIPEGYGVVGRVAKTKCMMNVRDVGRCPFFYCGIDNITGFVTRSILCFPVIDNAGVFVGVVELCNKEGKSGFTRHDEQRAKVFSVYCANSLSHCILLQKIKEAQLRTHMAGEYVVKDSPLTVDPMELARLSIQKIKPWHQIDHRFATFSFPPRQIGGNLDYVSAAMTMFNDLGFIQLYGMRQETLANFVLRVANGYRDVHYHNWSHAFAVAHFAWNALRTAKVRSALHELERLALLIACLCHDIDHRGTNNKFQLERQTPLAQLYSSEGSVLERHHYAQTVAILQSVECNILQSLTRTQFQCVLNHIRECILATDIAVHMTKVDRFKRLVEVGYNDLNSKHHYLLMCLIMTTSDLSDQSKDFTNAKAIAENIYREFFSQGDMEKAHGTEPMAMMDREKANVAQIQLEFMDNVAVPVFDLFAKLVPDGEPIYNSIRHNRQCWKTLDEILDARDEMVLGLDYLHDEKLEKEVLEEVERKNREEYDEEEEEEMEDEMISNHILR